VTSLRAHYTVKETVTLQLVTAKTANEQKNLNKGNALNDWHK